MTGRQRAAIWLLLPVLLFGLVAGLLMTWHHDAQLYGGEQVQLIGCEESAEVNCDIVNTSDYSELAGVPIAALSLPFYATIAVLALMVLAGRPGARTLIVVGGVAAVALSIFLFYISKTQLHYVCAWCIRMYAVNLSILVLGLLSGPLIKPGEAVLLRAGGVYLSLLVLTVVGERVYRGTLSGPAPATEVATTAMKLDVDPTGPAPSMSFNVTTEDKNERSFTLDPDDAWTGNKDAKVAVIMFGDLECGYCKRTSAELARLQATYSDRVLFVFKHFPMDPACNSGVKNRKHRYACRAAEASVCAQKQGRFWAFHDLAYKNQHQLGDDYLRTYATEVGVDGDKYDACMKTHEGMDEVKADAAVGATLDIHGTPRIYINGKLYRSGTSAEVMARAIEVALGANPADAAKAASALRDSADASAAIPADVPATRALSFDGKPFQIDSFEATIVEGAAVSGKHNIPAIRTSWFQAEAACKKAGKRMCTEEEWVSACQNAAAKDDNGNGELADDMIEGTAYPYGDFHDDNRCWDGHEGDKFRPVYTGEHPGCATPTGVYDMTGNVEEWVGATSEDAVLLGGAWDTTEDHARCYRRNDTFGAGYASVRSGFRCCSN